MFGAARSGRDGHPRPAPTSSAQDATAARKAAAEKAELVSRTARNGTRLLVESTRSGQWVSLCPLELESLTWQNTATFSAMIGNPFGPLLREEP